MPDKPLTVLTYAASASLAAVALVYLLNPSYLFETVPGGGNAAETKLRRGRAVGLSNPANDCFINSILQALASLGSLESYLVHELARREVDRTGPDGVPRIYAYRPPERESSEGSNTANAAGEANGQAAAAAGQNGAPDGVPGAELESVWKAQAQERKARSILSAEVTRGLKNMLDQLTEPSTLRKVISAAPFVGALESAFATRVNRNQQDAQELLQVVAERMAEEFTAGKKARSLAREEGVAVPGRAAVMAAIAAALAQDSTKESGEGREVGEATNEKVDPSQDHEHPVTTAVPVTYLNGESMKQTNGKVEALEGEQGEKEEAEDEEKEEFPLQGQTKHQIECQHCHFVPSSKPTDFIMLTLSVPPKSSATLDECLDQFSKPEFIDDYKCDKCRLVHALETYEAEASSKRRSEEEREELNTYISKLKLALQTDPESPPKDVPLPDSRQAPTRRIARSVKITSFPRILIIHLSRSSFDPTSFSSKNTAKVAFPEHLPLGTLTDRRKYRLQGVVTHKGTHYSGHYETFRRQYPHALAVSDLADEYDSIPPRSTQTTPGPSTAASPEPRPSATFSSGGEEASDEEASESSGAATGGGVSRSATSASKRNILTQHRSPTPSSAASAVSATPPRTSFSTLPTPESVLESNGRSPLNNSSSSPFSSPSSSHPDGVKPGTESPTPASSSSSSPLPPSSQPPHSQPLSTSLEVPRSSVALASAGVSAAAPGMERTSSRQRMREAIEEAKERKRDKRLRKLVNRENSRWWRISDDKVREAKTADVLGAAVQKEAYLLFYEMEG